MNNIIPVDPATHHEELVIKSGILVSPDFSPSKKLGLTKDAAIRLAFALKQGEGIPANRFYARLGRAMGIASDAAQLVTSILRREGVLELSLARGISKGPNYPVFIYTQP